MRRASARRQRDGSEPDREQQRRERRRPWRCRGSCGRKEQTMFDTRLPVDGTAGPADVLRLLPEGARQRVSPEALRGRATTGTATRGSQPSGQQPTVDIDGECGDDRAGRAIIRSRQRNGERRSQAEAETEGRARGVEPSVDTRDGRSRGGVASASGVHGTIGRQCGATGDEERGAAE